MKPAFDLRRRSSGVLMHLTSLPGPHGCGDLGPGAHRFVDFLGQAGQTWWQLLPVGPPGGAPAFSPYDSPSAFAGSPWLVSLELLARQGLLGRRDLAPAPRLPARRVDFPATETFREERLRRAFASFRRRRGERTRAFRAFCAANADWLEDFVLFVALRGSCAPDEWTAGERRRAPAALRTARARHADELAFQRFVQFEFDLQWRALRAHAHRRGIGLIGDLPLFVARESADVWSHPELFQLDRRGRPRRVSGYPPDRFNREGQLWGHPQYAWARHERSGFAWWLRRFARGFERFDAQRIDHFLGFTRTWSVPARAGGPRAGRWVRSPGVELFTALERALGPRPLIAEDLGRVTPADVRLRERFGLAPMRVLQFGLGDAAGSSEHLPHNHARLCAAYTGTHDTDTLVGWFRGLAPAQARRALDILGGSPRSVHTSALRLLLGSPASVAIAPLQDVFGLDGRARMNVPGEAEGNWRWRLSTRDLAPVARELRRLTEAFGRCASDEDTPRLRESPRS